MNRLFLAASLAATVSLCPALAEEIPFVVQVTSDPCHLMEIRQQAEHLPDWLGPLKSDRPVEKLSYAWLSLVGPALPASERDVCLKRYANPENRSHFRALATCFCLQHRLVAEQTFNADLGKQP
jgi:hypothetical protein